MQKYSSKKWGGNYFDIDEALLPYIKLSIQGEDNHISLKNITCSESSKFNINICGNNNTININSVSINANLNLTLGQQHKNFGPIINSSFIIKKHTSIESLEYITYNSHTECIIGENCMLSYNIILYNTDAHAILEYPSNKLVNYVKGIFIGNHCWIGRNVTIMRNTTIPDDCIIGAYSLASGNFKSSHSIYAGNPAKLIKTNRTWSFNGKQYGYIDNDI